MSFSSDTKDELARIYPEEEESKIAELAALIRTIGSISMYGNGKISLTFTTENASVARLVFKLIKDLFGIIPETMVRRGRYLKKP